MKFSRLIDISLLCMIVSLILLLGERINLVFSLVLLVSISGYASLRERNNVLHPWQWFSVFFLLYHGFYPFFKLLELSNVTDPFLAQTVKISIVALIGFLMGSALIEVSSKRIHYQWKNWSEPLLSTYIVYYFTLSLACLSSFIILSRGFDSKRQFVDSGESTFLSISFLLLTVTATLLLLMPSVKAKPFHILSVSTTLLIPYALVGERDFLLRFGLILFLIYFTFFRKYRFYYSIVLIVGLIFLIPLTQISKAFYATGNINTSRMTLLEYISLSDFSTASLNVLRTLKYELPQQQGDTYVNSVKRFFYLNDGMSTTAWFNTVIRVREGVAGRAGWGYSLVAESYVNYGMLWVFTFFFVLGFLMQASFKFASGNIWTFVIYLLSIPAVIYALRADLVNLISPIVKIYLPVTLITFSLHKTFKVIGERSSEMQISKVYDKIDK